MQLRPFVIALAAACATTLAAAADGPAFVDHSKPARLLDFDLHALLGGSTVTQNYRACFPQISELAITMGTSTGLGATAHASFTNFISLGTEANFIYNTYRTDMAVADDDATSIANVFTRNRFYTLNFPVYVTFSFNLARTVVWGVDVGGYYTFGAGGTSKSTIYSARVNPLGQLITTVTGSNAGYYVDPDMFISSFLRGDYGVHIASSLMFSRCVKVGMRFQMGIKNVAAVYNAVTVPNIHNLSFFGNVAWCF